MNMKSVSKSSFNIVNHQFPKFPYGLIFLNLTICLLEFTRHSCMNSMTLAEQPMEWVGDFTVLHVFIL